jgi:hypothetical protein
LTAKPIAGQRQVLAKGDRKLNTVLIIYNAFAISSCLCLAVIS